MRIMGWLLMAATMTFQPPSPSASARQGPDVRAQPVGTMSDLMVKIIYPASDAVFYIATREPKNEVEWGELQGKTLALAESANLLMMPGRARDQDRWMQDARLMLDAGMAAYRAARRKDVPALEAVNDQLYTSCTSCHQHYRPNYGRRAAPDATAAQSAPVAPSAPGAPSAQSVSRPASTVVAPPGPPAPSSPLAVPAPRAPSIVGRWKLRAAEDLRADGSVARYPWGPHPVGSIVVEGGACYLQIASSDTPSFSGGSTPVTEQMKAALVGTYIAYSGPCAINESEASVTLKVEAAWRPDYVGTEQKRFFRFENGALIFGPAPNSMRAGNETLTRRLTLDRVQ